MADVFSRVEQLQRIAEKMMTERDWALRRVRELEAERDRLKETIAWIWDHSNDPGVVERAREALNKADTTPQEADNG